MKKSTKGILIGCCVAFVLVGLVGVMLSIALIYIPHHFDKDAPINVFIADDAKQADVESLQRKLEMEPQVKSVDYISKAQALQMFKEQLNSSLDTTDNSEGNPLPASFIIKLNEGSDASKVVAMIRTSPEFESIADSPNDPQQSIKYGGIAPLLQRPYNFVKTLRTVDIAVLVGIAAFAAVVLVVSRKRTK